MKQIDRHERKRVLERKDRLDGTHDEFECEGLLVEPGKRAVLRYVLAADRLLEGADLQLAAGTVTIAHYWTGRPYNVYHWLSDGRTLGYYCNVVAATVIRDDVVSYDDLVVDVFIDPSGSALVLDEDELPVDLAPAHRAVINKALEELTGTSRRLAVEIERESRPFL